MYRLYIIFLFIIISSTAFGQKLSQRFIIPSDDKVHQTIRPLTPAATALNHREINILVWNIYKGAKPEWKQNYKSLLKDQDIVLAQEVYLNPEMKKVFKQSQLHYDSAVSFYDVSDNHTATGVATAARVKSDKIVWQRSTFREPVTKTPKMVLFTAYALEGLKESLLVGNIHGINFVTSRKLKHQLIKAAEVVKRHRGPVFFAGDFNTWTQSKLNIMKQVFSSVGMNLVQFDIDNRKKFMGKILDHVWVKNLNVLEARAPENNGSDHNPMLIRVSL